MQLHPTVTNAEAPASRTPYPESASPRSGSRLRRRILWSGAVVAAILLLIFLPPLVNANHYQRQIARSMSASLGRPVHLDNATLHLLPVPGLTLTNLVVSEDPAFGDEPTIRANTVEATLRLGSLWRHPVEFSTVHFIEPSVNLVRNPQGRWNLADVLLHASHVATAPTAQVHAGPAPRFPYIEATGGRVNVKLGAEKLPFSLTDTDFALWLPSPNQWKVRLQGQPARTDTNLNDPGTLRIEGGLQRAETATGIPVNLEASWHDAPLGEASRLVTGDDMGWRGTLNVDATLAGTLSQAVFASKVTLGDVRRAEFAAVHPLDLQITCGAGISAAAALLSGLNCTMPDSAPSPLLLHAGSADLNRLGQTSASLDAEDIPLHWGMLWAALFSARVPTDLHPDARVDVHLQHLMQQAAPNPGFQKAAKRSGTGRGRRAQVRDAAAGAGPWTGEVVVHLPPSPAVNAGPGRSVDAALPPTDLVWHPVSVLAGTPKAAGVSSNAGGLGFLMGPVSVPLAEGSSLTLSASIGPSGYTVSANGSASTAALLLPARYLPQLADGLTAVLPAGPADLGNARVDFTCNHPWGALQTCVSLRPTVPGRGAGRSLIGLEPGVQTGGRAGGSAPIQGVAPVQLAPRSLSPFDRDPRLGGTPQEQPYPSSQPAATPTQPQPPGALPHL